MSSDKTSWDTLTQKEQNYLKSVFAGAQLVLKPPSEGVPDTEFFRTVDAELDFRGACLPYLQLHQNKDFPPSTPTRVFHNITHPLESSEKVMPIMARVHGHIKETAPDDRLLTMEEAATLYHKALQQEDLTQEEMLEGALLDSIGYWHDTVYNCDEMIHPDTMILLCRPWGPLEKKGETLTWSKEGIKEFPVEYALLKALDKTQEATYAGPYPLPTTGKPQNEVLSALAAASSMKRLAIENTHVFVVFTATLNTVPFGSHHFQDFFEQCVREAGKEYGITADAIERSIDIGLRFTNLADIETITRDFPLGKLDLFSARGIHLAFENQPLLKMRKERITAEELTACLMGSIFFGETVIADPLKKADGGTFAVAHTTGKEMAKKTLTLNTNASHNFQRAALIDKARCVGALVAAALLPPDIPGDALQPHFERKMGKAETYTPALGKTATNILEKSPAEISAIQLLNNCHMTIEGSGTDIPIGLPTDRFAAELLDKLGSKAIHSLYMTIIPALGEKDIAKRAEKIKTIRPLLTCKLCDLLKEKGMLNQLRTAAKRLDKPERADLFFDHWVTSQAIEATLIETARDHAEHVAEMLEIHRRFEEEIKRAEDACKAVREKLDALEATRKLEGEKEPEYTTGKDNSFRASLTRRRVRETETTTREL
jgi:hypothetical protein